MRHASHCAVNHDREFGLCSCGADEIPAMRADEPTQDTQVKQRLIAVVERTRAADQRNESERASRARAALVVANGAFQAAWAPVLASVRGAPASKEKDAAAVAMFEIESRFADVLRLLSRLT